MRVLRPLIRILAWPVLARLLVILAVVEAIFLAESFTTLLEEALRNDAVAADVGILLVFRMPQILDLALAVGVLIAVYFVISDARNRGELIILAASGIRWRQVVMLMVLLGLIGGAVSVATAGYLSPLARYASRIKMAELKTEYIVSRIEQAGPLNSRQTIRDVTFIATPPRDEKFRRGQLFVFQPDVDGQWRAVQSSNWRVTDPDKDGQRAIVLDSLSALEARYPRDGAPMTHINAFNVNQAEFGFGLADVTEAPDRERSKAERLLNISPAQTPRLTRIVTRALMVPMAALLALAAIVAGGAGIRRYVALPIAAVILMAGDVAARSVLAGAVEAMSPFLLLGLAVALYLGPPLAYLGWRGEALMIPAARRA